MYELFEHQADVGVRGLGSTLEEAFQEGAKAMFEVMVDLSQIAPKVGVDVTAFAPNQEELFVEFLNQLLYLRDVQEMFFSDFKINSIEKKEENDEVMWYLKGVARGEKIKPKIQRIKVDVKAATFSQLSVKEKDGQWMAQCIVDV
jgi:SHS2 domain-containing protein